MLLNCIEMKPKLTSTPRRSRSRHWPPEFWANKLPFLNWSRSSPTKEMLRPSSQLTKRTMLHSSSKRTRFRTILTRPPTTLFPSKKKCTRPTRHLLSFWNSSRMLRLRLRLLSNTSLTWNRESLFTFQLRMILLTESLPSSLTTTLKDPNSRSCSWESLKVFTSLVPRELLSRLRRTISRLELEEDIFPLMSSLINTPQLSSRNLKEKIHSRDSVKRLLSRRQLSIKESAKTHQSDLQEEAHPRENKLFEFINQKFEEFIFEFNT